MAKRTRILVADRDLNSLSRIYLGLLHRNYKVEATNNMEEIQDRINRLKPNLLILGAEEFHNMQTPLKIPCIVLDAVPENKFESNWNIRFMEINPPLEQLVRTIEEMII